MLACVQNHSLIAEIHIKDRYFNGSSDRLGCADVDFDSVARILNNICWNGLVVLETPIFNDWRIEAEHNILFTKKWISKIISDR